MSRVGGDDDDVSSVGWIVSGCRFMGLAGVLVVALPMWVWYTMIMMPPILLETHRSFVGSGVENITFSPTVRGRGRILFDDTGFPDYDAVKTASLIFYATASLKYDEYIFECRDITKALSLIHI